MQDFKSVVEWGVIGLLLSLSAWAVAVALERWRFYRQVQVQSYRSRVRLETELTSRLNVGTFLPKINELPRAAGREFSNPAT